MTKIRNFIRQMLKEALVSFHAKERFTDRFLSSTKMSVGIEIKHGEYDAIGRYIIDEQTITELKTRFSVLTKTSFPKNKSYAVKILDIIIPPEKIIYFNPEDKIKYTNTKIHHNPFVLLNDATHDSNGNVVYAIIRNGEIITIMLVKNYVAISKEKMQVDFIVKDWNLILQHKIR